MDEELIERRLEKMKVTAYTCMSTKLAEDPLMSMSFFEATSEDMAIRLVAMVWGEDVGIIKIEYPADWWQAFKKRWFPIWALKRFPTRVRKHEIDIKQVYPRFKPAPRLGDTARICRITERVIESETGK